MFVKHSSNRFWYSYDGTQRAYGKFLAVFQTDARYSDGLPALFAVVRTVKMRQLGHWMMGMLNLGQYRFSISGAIGHDGLPMSLRGWHKDSPKGSPMVDVPFDAIRKYLTLVPEDVARVYWTDNEGWNSLGAKGKDAFGKWIDEAKPFKNLLPKHTL